MDYDLDVLTRQIMSRLSPGDAGVPDRACLCDQVAEFLTQARLQGNLEDMIRQMVTFVGADRLLPACYARFQPMVTESSVYLLGQLPLERLACKIIDQLRLDPGVSPGRRICTLIQDLPSLQKLGQIICRTPGLTHEFKQAMVDLEDNINTVSMPELMPLIEAELEALKGSFSVRLDKRILAEASVCAVVAGTLRTRGEPQGDEIVLKILKPHISQNLTHEIKMLNGLALFLDQNKERWELGDFKFKDTLAQVQWLLENEVNLTREQENLREAGRYYRQHRRLIIPRCLAGSTSAVTVMSRQEGRKITDVDDLDRHQKRQLAEILTEICILRPIKDLGHRTLFHGDPHGGNIAYFFEGGQARIILYDWGMLGRLSRLERHAFALMGLGVMTRSVPMVLFAVDIVTGGQILKNRQWQPGLRDTVKQILERRGTLLGDVLTDIGAVFAEVAYQGIIFPTDLMMFQKSLVTLKGVIADIDPDFDYDEEWIGITIGSYLGDLRRPRYYFEIYKEIWALRRYSVGRILQMHRLVTRLLRRLGIAGLKFPLRILGVALLLAPLPAGRQR